MEDIKIIKRLNDFLEMCKALKNSFTSETNI